MSDRQVKISLVFDANTAAAKQNIEQLSSLLHKISTKTVIGVDGGNISQAVQAARQLQAALETAVNVNTGKLNLMQLQQNLKAANTDLSTLTTNLQIAGSIGEQALLKLGKAVSQAEVPMIRTNGLIHNFMTTLANTAKWQVASSAIHGLMKTFNQAISHAKNLNKALTDIQIVTHYSDEYMAKFAQTASKAASALNTTTTEYAKAALIFYQQGLSGSAVEDRAATVIKLAQVTGQSAKVVSDQMTAIWNNFAQGSYNLERYADVLTKLGAATAASTDEISDGLQRFAAVAKTVGLSYETAAASVATVIDKTRQSADVVGTSFKTIFARMEGLSLGDTLEDGVNLNKYSEALEKVGVHVLNARGQLRSMDAILNDLGEKWQGLGEETQIALAQTVGGVRQYNQMLAMMNNWEDIKNNIELARDATGELNIQQNIWAKSYEGSLQKLEQAKNELYEQFINDELLISFNKGLTQIVNAFSLFVDQLGGVGPLLLMVSGIFSKTLLPLMAGGFKRLTNAVSVWSGSAMKQVSTMQNNISAELNAMVNNGSLTNGMKEQLILTDSLIQAKQKLMLSSKQMTAAQRAEAESRLAVAESLMTETMQLLKQQDAMEQKVNAVKADMFGDLAARKSIATVGVSDQYQTQQQKKPLAEGETVESRQANIETVIQGASTRSTENITAEMVKAEKTVESAKVEKAHLTTNIAQQQQTVDTASAEVQSALAKGDEAAAENARVKESTALKELKALQDQAKAQDEIISDGESRIEQLNEMLQLRKDINGATNDTKQLEKLSVGDKKITSIQAGGIDKEGNVSGRLAAEDADLDPIAQSSAQQQMQAVNQSFNGPDAELGAGDTMTIEASIANYEKLYKAVGDQAVISAKLKGATQEVNSVMKSLTKQSASAVQAEKKLNKEQKAAVHAYLNKDKTIKKLSKDQKAYLKALQTQNKAQQASVKTLKANRQQYMDLAQSAKLSEGEMKKLGKAFDMLGGDVQEQKAGLAIIEKVFKSLGVAADGVGTDLQLMADNMEQALRRAGLPKEKVDELTAALKELAAQAPITAGSMRQTKDAFDQATPSATSLISSFSNVGTTALQLTGSVMGLVSSLDDVKSLFTETLEPQERFQKILSAIMGILPIAILLTTGLAKALDVESASSYKAFIAKQAEIKASNMSTGAKWANTAANIANLLSNPFTMALAAVAIVAIGMAIGALTGLTKKTNEDTEANLKLSESQLAVNKSTMEQASKIADLADAWMEQMGLMDSLIAKYNDLDEAQKKTAESTEDILNAVPDLIKAYDDLAENVLIDSSSDKTKYQDLKQQLENAAAMGNIEEIQKTTYAIDKLLAPKSAVATQSGVSAAQGNVLSDFYEADLKEVKGLKYTDGTSKVFVEDLEADSRIYEKLKANGLTAQDSRGYAGLALRTDTNDHFIQDYDKMKKIYEDALKNDPSMAEDEGMQMIKKLLESTSDSYEQMRELRDNVKTQLAAEASLSVGDLNDIDDYGEYEKHRFDAIQKLSTSGLINGDEAEKYVDEFLGNNEATKNYNLMKNRIEALKDNGSDFTARDLAQMTEEEQQLFLKININEYETKSAIQGAIAIAQREADANEIITHMGVISSAKEALKDDGMTSADWANIRDGGIEWGTGEADDDRLTFEEFLSMTYKEQSERLNEANQKLQERLIVTKKQSVVEAQMAIEQLQLDLKSRAFNEETMKQKQQELDTLKEKQKELNDQILIEQELLENMKANAVDLNADEVKSYVSHLKEVSENSDIVSKHLKDNSVVANLVARATMRMNRGVETLNENFGEWEDILTHSNKGSQEYSEALGGLREAMSDILDVDEEFLSSEFLTNSENLELMSEAAQGSAEAIDKLGKVAAKDILLQVTADDTQVQSKIMQLHETLMNQMPNLKVGATIDAADFQAILDTSKMTVEQAQAYFNSLGYDPVFEMTEQEAPLMGTKTETKDVTVGNVNGFQYIESATTTQTEVETGKQTISVPAVSADGTPKIKSITKKSAGAMNNFSTANSGGTKIKKANKIDAVKEDEIVERYKEIIDTLDDVENAMDKVSKAADRLYGQNHIKALEKQNKLTKDKIELLEKQKKQAQNNLEIDKEAFAEAAKAAGVSFTLDKSRNITNYTEQMTKLSDELSRRTNIANSYNNEEQQSKYIEDNIEPLKKIIEDLKSAMSKYEDTRELVEDLDNSLLDELYATQDRNAEILNYKLELAIEIDESDLEEIDYYLSKIEDDFYSMAEGAALLFNDSVENGKNKFNIYAEGFKVDSDYFSSLQLAYSNKDISQQAYVEGMKSVASGALADAQAIRELDDTMMEYYGNTMSMAGEELAKYTERMEHSTAVLEHYKSIVDILGQSTDYEALGIILEGQAKTIENELAVAKKNYEMLAGETEHWKQMMESVDETDPAFELYQKNWEAAESAAREAQDNMLSKTEEWAEAMKAILENKLAGLASTLENALTGGTSFETISTQMERAASLQEEYLTSTNKIYNTNKMINTAQKEIDKTTNTVAKQKLKSFQQETIQLQNKSKLSQYELDIQQAKYNLLLAEIALEEAQWAKSTVRLQRDASGNFGYVYTADQNKIADAEQKVLDAQNALYNKGLEGTNDYVQKYQSTMSEMYDSLSELQEKYLNGEFETEEQYHAAMDEAKSYYYQKLQDYSSLYQVAATTDSRVIADAWSTDFADMTYDTELWKDEVENYLDDVKFAFEEWEDTVNKLKTETVGSDLTELKNEVEDIVTESDNLTDAIVKDGGLLNAMEKQLDGVGKITEKYAAQRITVSGLITDYELLAAAAKTAWQEQQRLLTGDSETPEGDTGGGDSADGDVVGTDGDVTQTGVTQPETPEVDPALLDDGNGREEPETLVEPTKPNDIILRVESSFNDTGRGGKGVKASEVVVIGYPPQKNSKGQDMYPIRAINISGEETRGYVTQSTVDQYGLYKMQVSEYLKKKKAYDEKMASMDTGGYTGSWGTEGKLAMLHQKEIVLNADDTANFLASLEILRDIINVIDLHSMSAQIGGLLTSPYYTNTSDNQVLEQNVHIEASFPGVSDRYEIEEAFNNLVNKASQYVNRK